MIVSPTFLVNEEQCRINIRTMAEKAKANNVVFRPHFKTHQSHEIGAWFREEGVSCITVSSLKMAMYFAEDDWDDITVAFPVNILEIEKINSLASRLTLNLVVEAAETVNKLNDELKHDVNLFIKVDIGYHRTGADPENQESMDQILKAINDGAHTSLCGFLGHAGHSYTAYSDTEIASVHESSTQIIAELKAKYLSKYPGIIISVGDTPTCSVMEDFSMVDEIRPGNFIFYDLTQNQIGSCSLKQISVAMACPVVAIHKERSEIIIYGGGVHFSKERLKTQKYGTIYGLVVEDKMLGWGAPVDDVYLSKISQEHGTIKATESYIDSIDLGDIVKILPVHSCMTADLFSAYLSTSGREISRLSK